MRKKKKGKKAEQVSLNEAAAQLGRIGGKNRVAGMTSEEIRKAAQKAANARWKKVKEKAKRNGLPNDPNKGTAS